MRGVNPAVEAPGERVGHAVRVAKAVGLIKRFAFVSLAVAVSVGEALDVRNAVDQRRLTAGHRQDADRDVQAVGERGDFPGVAVGTEVGEDLDRIARGLAVGGGEGIFERVGDPEPAEVVERDVHRLVDFGFGRDEFGDESRRQMKCLDLFLRSSRRLRRDVLGAGARRGVARGSRGAVPGRSRRKSGASGRSLESRRRGFKGGKFLIIPPAPSLDKRGANRGSFALALTKIANSRKIIASSTSAPPTCAGVPIV